MSKSVQCQDCIHYIFHENIETTRLFCTLKNKYISFRKPTHPHDDNCGWKANCKEFKKDLNEYQPKVLFVNKFKKQPVKIKTLCCKADWYVKARADFRCKQCDKDVTLEIMLLMDKSE